MTVGDYDVSKLNDLLQTANETLACGPSCQKDKQSSVLHENMLKAQQNIKTAPEEYEKAAQAYITFTEGDAAYATYHETELTKQADRAATAISRKLTEWMTKVRTEIEVNENLAKNVHNVSDLLEKYKTENDGYRIQLHLRSADVVTNERKTFYEDQVIATQQYYSSLLSYIYMIAVVLYLVSGYMQGRTTGSQLLMLVFFVLYYFFGAYMIGKIIQFFYYIMPKNVYSELNKPPPPNRMNF
jgi:hypothetical protein